MRKVGVAGLIIGMLLVSGCFQAEAPRPAARPANDAANDSRTQQQAVMRVEADDEPPAVPALAAILRERSDPASRREAVYAIADIGSQADSGFVGEALVDPDHRVRRAAVVALTGFGAEASVCYLALALNDPDPRVRMDAVEALGNVGSLEARLALQQGAIDPDPRVRAAAEQMLEEPERRQR